MTPALPEPEPMQTEPTHTVVVNDVPVRELLFSLARDSELNLDIDGDVNGLVTLNAINQPLPAILERIVEANGLRYDIKNSVLRVRRDAPFLHNYRVDYLNMARRSRGSVNVSTQISATGQGASGEGGGGGSGNNNSATVVENLSDNEFWNTLHQNIAAILNNAAADGGGAVSHPDILLNREAGILGVRANHRQHREIQEFIDEVLMSSHRQVLIEATIAEVKLSDRYQAGIDWVKLRTNADKTTDLFQSLTDITLFNRPSFNLQVTKDDGSGDVLQATLSALETFGDVSVMSSPKVMAINNQTALLKVVDNLVYFTVDVDIDAGSDTQSAIITYETEVHTVPVGFVMSVTPYISQGGIVTLNVRPTISRVIGQARDPSPALAQADTISEIPIIQVREVESVLKVASGNIAVMGGLMQDEISKTQRGVPFLSKIPFLGPLFRYQDDSNDKTELVIFIRPVVIDHASVTDDFRSYQRYLPKPNGNSGQ
jgi:general secretion pathway protein D